MRLWKIVALILVGYGITKYVPVYDTLHNMFLDISSKLDKHDQDSQDKGEKIREVFGNNGR